MLDTNYTSSTHQFGTSKGSKNHLGIGVVRIEQPPFDLLYISAAMQHMYLFPLLPGVDSKHKNGDSMRLAYLLESSHVLRASLLGHISRHNDLWSQI